MEKEIKWEGRVLCYSSWISGAGRKFGELDLVKTEEAVRSRKL